MSNERNSLVQLDGGKPRARAPKARAGDDRNGVAAGVLAIDLDAAGEEQPGERDARGRFLPGAKAGPRKGAIAAQRATKYARDLGLAKATPIAPYLHDARHLARYVLADLAKLSGGQVSAIVGAMVQSAALQLAGSRFLFDRGDITSGSRAANDARSSLAMARHIAAQDGLARKAGGHAVPALDAATEAELDRQVAELVAAHGKSTTGNNVVTESDAEPGTNVVTQTIPETLETEGDDE